MANVVLVLGKSGTGKSTSIKGLDPKATVIVNILKKRLPFKGSQALYSKESKNFFSLSDYSEINSLLKSVSEKAGYVRNIVIDDATYIMRKEYFKTAKITGYNKFVDMASHFQSIIETAESLRQDLNVFIMMHCEEVMSDNVIVGYKPSTVGKLIDNSYNPVEVVALTLFSDIMYDESKNPVFGFHTKTGVTSGNIVLPCKSPEGMFDEDFIPNDLGYVTRKMEEYYA